MRSKEKDLVFVLSGGRTGTQFLGDRLSSAILQSFSVHDPDVLSIFIKRVPGRLKTFGIWNMTIGKATGQTGVRSIGQRLITGKIDLPTALFRLKKSREAYHSSITAPLIIESNSQWLYVCDELAMVWPHARVIVVVRDPRTWIRSWLNKGVRWHWYDPVRWLPPGRLTPALVDDRDAIYNWGSLGPHGRLAWEWRFIYGRLLRHVKINTNARLFRFEDIFQGGNQETMRQLVQFAARHSSVEYEFHVPEDFTRNAHNASHGRATDWHDWSERQAKLVDRFCGPLMKGLGYGNEESWKQKIKP